MTKEKLEEHYAQEPWGKLIIEMGWRPRDTETCACRVAEYAAKKLAEKDAEIERLREKVKLLSRTETEQLGGIE